MVTGHVLCYHRLNWLLEKLLVARIADSSVVVVVLELRTRHVLEASCALMSRPLWFASRLMMTVVRAFSHCDTSVFDVRAWAIS